MLKTNATIQHRSTRKRPWAVIIWVRLDWSYYGFYKTEEAAKKVAEELREGTR